MFRSCFRITGNVILNLSIEGKGLGPMSGRLPCVAGLNTDLKALCTRNRRTLRRTKSGLCVLDIKC